KPDRDWPSSGRQQTRQSGIRTCARIRRSSRRDPAGSRSRRDRPARRGRAPTGTPDRLRSGDERSRRRSFRARPARRSKTEPTRRSTQGRPPERGPRARERPQKWPRGLRARWSSRPAVARDRERRDEDWDVVVRFAADLDVERHAPEETAIELKNEPVAPGSERTGQLGDAAVGVGHAASDDSAVLFQGGGHTRCRTAPRQVLVYPGGFSEMEILFPYGATMFSSKVGQLAGNHFATVVEGNAQLAEIGRLTLWEGAQDFSITEE